MSSLCVTFWQCYYYPISKTTEEQQISTKLPVKLKVFCEKVVWPLVWLNEVHGWFGLVLLNFLLRFGLEQQSPDEALQLPLFPKTYFSSMSHLWPTVHLPAITLHRYILLSTTSFQFFIFFNFPVRWDRREERQMFWEPSSPASDN